MASLEPRMGHERPKKELSTTLYGRFGMEHMTESLIFVPKGSPWPISPSKAP